jgi:hypothetical protein
MRELRMMKLMRMWMWKDWPVLGIYATRMAAIFTIIVHV